MKKQPLFQPNWTWLMNNKIAFIGFGFGSGLIPKAPGTMGSIVGMWLAGLLLGSGMNHTTLFIFTLILFGIGIWICDETERALGCVHDYKGIVWDEIVAILLIYALIPQGFFWWTLAFVLFRFFDIIKPQPVKWADNKLEGGLGVMVDDVIAAVYTIIIIQFIHLLI